MVQPPIIRECIARLECKLHKKIKLGDHTLFIGQVLAAHANRDVFDKRLDLRKAKPVYHIGRDDFVTVVPEIFTLRL